MKYIEGSAFPGAKFSEDEMKAIFNLIDKNGDGQISKTEMNQFITEILKDPS